MNPCKVITVPPVNNDGICTNLQIIHPACTCMQLHTSENISKELQRSKYLTSIMRLEMEIFNTYVLSVQNCVSQNSVTAIAPVKYTPSVNRSNNINF